MSDENPQPDPGNSPPENWTEELTLEEQVAAVDALATHVEERAAEAEASEAGRAAADFEVVDGRVVPVDKSEDTTTSSSLGRGEATVNFVEPSEVQEPTPAENVVPPVEEATADDGSSSGNNG